MRKAFLSYSAYEFSDGRSTCSLLEAELMGILTFDELRIGYNIEGTALDEPTIDNGEELKPSSK